MLEPQHGNATGFRDHKKTRFLGCLGAVDLYMDDEGPIVVYGPSRNNFCWRTHLGWSYDEDWAAYKGVSTKKLAADKRELETFLSVFAPEAAA